MAFSSVKLYYYIFIRDIIIEEINLQYIECL